MVYPTPLIFYSIGASRHRRAGVQSRYQNEDSLLPGRHELRGTGASSLLPPLCLVRPPVLQLTANVQTVAGIISLL
jgi:hypothetical protein